MSEQESPIIQDIRTAMVKDHDADNITLQKAQYLSPEFMTGLKHQRENSLGLREGEMMSVAKVPVIVVERWLADGFDIMKEPAHKIVARLKQEHLDGFLTTKKKV